jgi:hypothetical protein
MAIGKLWNVQNSTFVRAYICCTECETSLSKTGAEHSSVLPWSVIELPSLQRQRQLRFKVSKEISLFGFLVGM